MKGLELIINFVDVRAYLSEEKYLFLSQLDLPEIAKRFRDPASWTIRVLNYLPLENKLFAEIVSYRVGNSGFSMHQQNIAEEIKKIEKISFRSIDTHGLLRTLRGNSEPVIIYPRNEMNIENEERLLRENKNDSQPGVIVVNDTWEIPIKNIRFRFGCVSFDKFFRPLEKAVEFSIYNDELREEFDSVKNYFANVLKTKRIRVDVRIYLKDGNITGIETLSPEVSKIDKKLIESVKFEFVKTFSRKKIIAEIDKSLFTMDEFFETLSENEVKADTFYRSDNDLFEDLIQISQTKHYKQLRFLSSRHAHSIMKLRFVIRPFSFVFLIEGERKYHIVWETLNTEEATWIWSVEKDLQKLKLTLKKIEDILNVVKVQGKTAYINSADDELTRIYHDYSDLLDGFVKWKGEVESRFV